MLEVVWKSLKPDQPRNLFCLLLLSLRVPKNLKESESKIIMGMKILKNYEISTIYKRIEEDQRKQREVMEREWNEK